MVLTMVLVEIRRFEPPDPCLQGRCSPAELYPPKYGGGPSRDSNPGPTGYEPVALTN